MRPARPDGIQTAWIHGSGGKCRIIPGGRKFRGAWRDCMNKLNGICESKSNVYADINACSMCRYIGHVNPIYRMPSINAYHICVGRFERPLRTGVTIYFLRIIHRYDM